MSSDLEMAATADAEGEEAAFVREFKEAMNAVLDNLEAAIEADAAAADVVATVTFRIPILSESGAQIDVVEETKGPWVLVPDGGLAAAKPGAAVDLACTFSYGDREYSAGGHVPLDCLDRAVKKITLNAPGVVVKPNEVVENEVTRDDGKTALKILKRRYRR